MAPALDVDVIRSEVLAVVIALASDRIPNIRFNVAKALEVLAVRLGTLSGGRELIEQGVMPSLEGLLKDKDADVRFFAEKATGIARDILNGTEEGQAVTKEVVMEDA